MNTNLIILISISELISLILIIKLWLKNDYFLMKIGVTLITLIPFFGPLLYVFISFDLEPQDKLLQNRSYRGTFTHCMISLKPTLDKIINQKKNEVNRKHKDT